MDLKNFLDEYVQSIIQNLNEEFDTHDFINQFIKGHEKEYVKFLYSHIDKDGVFKMAHSEIGKYLASVESIQKMDRVKSENIKKYNSENQSWRKIR